MIINLFFYINIFNNTYKIKDENMEDSGYEFEKGRIKAQTEQMKTATSNFSLFLIIPIVTFLIMVVFITIGISSTRKSINKTASISNTKKIESSDSFNIYLSSGRKYCVFLENELEHIITSNKTHDEKQITVKYNDIETCNPDKIKELKKGLDRSKEYEITLDYDDEGYIKLYTIEDL